jgi:mannose-6-phosphate isomerase-like protein (cupin superfamily)
MPDKVNLAAALASFDETWSPRVAAEVDDFQVKLTKLEGDFVWHHHDDADELFWVLEGRLLMRFQDRDDVWLEPGELLVVPRGVEHQPARRTAAPWPCWSAPAW